MPADKHTLPDSHTLSNGHAISRGHTVPNGDTSPGAIWMTPRQLEITRLVARGHSNQEIAAMLDIAPKTVRNHIYTITRQIGRTGRTQLAMWAIRTGKVELDSIKFYLGRPV